MGSSNIEGHPLLITTRRVPVDSIVRTTQLEPSIYSSSQPEIDGNDAELEPICIQRRALCLKSGMLIVIAEVNK